jgi:PGF-pre-PGF domain-containing protein
VQNPVHTYALAGIYTVSLNATNAGGSNTKTAVDYITVNVPAPVTNFSANQTVGTMPMDVQFTDTSTGTPTSWNWSFGDGSLATVQHPVHTYASAGIYTVSLNATNAGGSNTKTIPDYITVNVPAPVTNFSANQTVGTMPMDVQFTDLSTEIPTSWNWSFGDGSLATVQNPVHTYALAGIYTVSLNATNAGGSNTKTIPDYITVNVPAPVTNFSANQTVGTMPMDVQFTDTSTGTPTSWNWSFGDGGLSTAQHPVHTYVSAGIYTVSLNATNAGGSNTKTIPDYITVNVPAPVANFSANQTVGTMPMDVAFTDSSTGTPTSWNWSFGDGSLATVQNPVHTYVSAGIYTVSLNATNAGGSNTKTIPDYITVNVPAPVTNFSANQTVGTMPMDVAFTDLSTETPTSWNWSFGDGSLATVQHPVHTYASAGIYTVSLNATNAGGSNTKTIPDYITVNVPAPVTNFSANQTVGTMPMDIQFTDLSTETPTSWNWSFGDGSLATVQHPVHTYASAGIYTVSLNATNAGGSNTKTIPDYITVNVPAPVANFSANQTVGTMPMDVAFTDSSTGTPTSWNWSFGDGELSTAQHPVHTYASAGIYTVSLNATNAGGSNTKTAVDYITVNVPAPVTNFSANQTVGTMPMDVAFTDLSTETPTSWNWSFGDGELSTAQHPVHTYASAGIYTVSLNATNAGGSNTKTAVDYITVNVPAPVANFSANQTVGTMPMDVQFTDSSIGTPTSWNWSFGDGGLSTAQHPVHTYASAGIYTVSLNATNAGGSNTKTAVDYITVNVPAPVTNFSANQTVGTMPMDVQFTDTSTGTPTSWNWSFGDGSLATVQNPVHTYALAGIYTVSLNATNAGGSNTKTAVDYITVNVPAPVANFSANQTVGTMPMDVQFTDSSTGTPTSWNWSFGDGGLSTAQHPVHTYETAGTYTVLLNATNAGGSNITTRTDYITVTVPAPVANFTGTPTSGTAPLTVTFTDVSTNAPTSWNWTFGDGSTSGEQHPVHIYQINGTYTVSLTATNAAGSGNFTKTDYITVSTGVITPIANFTGTPTSGVAPLTVTFTDSSKNAPTSWTWDFGDGNTSVEQHPVHIYQINGTYTVSLTATNAAGSGNLTKTNYISVTSGVVPPVANFAGTPTSGKAPLPVTFTDSSTNTPTSWSWNFGDGSTSVEQHPVHIYQVNGTYTVSLTATNAAGSGNLTRTDYITVTTGIIRPVADFTCTPTSGTAPLIVTFTDYSTPSPTSWNWTFGDGSISTEQHPVHNFTTAGTYTIALTATNDGGSTTMTRYKYINVFSSAPEVSFNGTPTFGTEPLSVTFMDSSTNSPTSWNWTFGDGSVSTEQHPVHNFTTSGTYTVSLTATNAGGSNMMTRSRYITAFSATPEAYFTATPYFGMVPLTVTFTDSSTRNPTSWNWSFGDGGSSTLKDPVHTYTAPGTYTVSLTVANTAGTNTMTRTVNVLTSPPVNITVANFTSGQPSYTNLTLVTNSSTSTNATSWNWTFGDGGTSDLENPNHSYAAPGTYTVTLTTTHSEDESSSSSFTNSLTAPIVTTSTVSMNVVILGLTPQPDFASNVTTGSAPLPVAFTDTSAQFPTNWNWSFGDGGTSTLKDPVHTYLKDGNYTVSLTASNTIGNDTITRSNYITVHTLPPGAYFNATPVVGTAPLTVTFTDGSTRSPSSWNWSFGDNGTSTLQHPVYTYMTIGSYTVALTTTNAGGNDTITRTSYITVQNLTPAPTVTGITPSSGMNNAVVGITRLAGTGFSGTPTVTLTKAGQGNITATGVTVIDSTNITCTFDLTGKAPGLWNVIVTNPDGQAGTLIAGFTITTAPVPPVEDSNNFVPDRSGQGGSGVAIASEGPAGQSVGYSFGNPSATYPISILSVSFVPAEAVPQSQCVVEQQGPASAFGLADRPAAYESIEIIWVNPAVITIGRIHFSVLGSWLREKHIDPTRVVLLRSHDNVWTELPTTFDHQDGDNYYYYADTTGFSYFAVSERRVVPTVVVTPQVTVSTAPEILPASPTVTVTTTSTPVPTRTSTPVPPTPAPEAQGGTPAAYYIAGGVIGVLLIVGVFVGWRRWQGRQKPKL